MNKIYRYEGVMKSLDGRTCFIYESLRFMNRVFIFDFKIFIDKIPSKVILPKIELIYE